MRKIIIIGLLLLGLSAESYAVKAPKVETLPDGYLIVGQYMIYRTQLTQDNFDGAMMTTSDVQKIYYKSEFAEGTWFNIDESQELVEILMDGGGQSVSEEWLNTFTFSVQIDEDGKIIKFTEGENVQTIEDFINALKAEQAALENDLKDLAGDKADEIAEEASDLAVRISALNKTIGIDDTEEKNERILLELLTQAQDSGNKTLEEAIQKELALVNPKLTDPEVLIAIVEDLLKEKEALLLLEDQAKRNGFDTLLEALAVELESKEALLEDALLNAKEAVAATGDATAKDALDTVIQASIALESLGQVQVLVGYVSVLEAIDAITDTLLTAIFDKVILEATGSRIEVSNLTEEVKHIDNARIKAQLKRLVETTEDMLDPLSTVDILDKNMLFSFEEISTLTIKLREELFLERQENSERESLLHALLSEKEIEEQTIELSDVINNIIELIDLSSTRAIESGLEAEIENELIQLGKSYAVLNQPMIELFESNKKLQGHKIHKQALLDAIDQLIVTAKSSENMGLAEDLKVLKEYLLEIFNELNRNDYDDYMSYLKRRYFLLKDYSSDKEKELNTSITDYTRAIAELDKLIYTIQSKALVDMDEIDLDFEAWRLTYDGSFEEQEDAKLRLIRYRENKKRVVQLSIDEMNSHLESLNQLLLLLESVELNNEAIDYRMSVLKNIIGQTKELLNQLNDYYGI